MNIKTISNKTITKTTIFKDIEIDNKYIVKETYDQKLSKTTLINQGWSIKEGIKSVFKDAYEPEHLIFDYYDDISFLESEENSNYQEFWDNIPSPSLVKDWNNFKGFDHVLCNYLSMDSCIYKISDPNPISLWRHKHYIGSIDNGDVNLNDAIAVLEKYSWIRNIEVVEIPYYNKEQNRTHAIEFDYKLPKKKDLSKVLRKEELFKDIYFGT